MKQLLDLSRYREFSMGSEAVSPDSYHLEELLVQGPNKWSVKFRIFKWFFDKATALFFMPAVGLFAVVLLLLNPWLNPGSVFFKQERMGLEGKPFLLWKFRTMSPDDKARDPTSPVESERITKLGQFMRKLRIDEWPNFINVLRGEMSVIGPRPDAYHHATYFGENLRGYAERHRVKPGITGLAQVQMGYAEGLDPTSLKAKYDNMYVALSCGRLDLFIIRQTFRVILSGFGAK